MNTFQSCRNTSDAVPLYLPQNLYLKPIARIHISVQLPHEIEAGRAISNWEIMGKLRQMIKPDEFTVLKVSKSTLEFLRFEAEIEDKSKLFKIIALLDARTIKLAAFTQNVKIRATEAKSEFPSRHAWDSFFRDAKNMDEMKPGERPDTIHIANLPIMWFVPEQHANKENVKPSQKILVRVFEKFGSVRHVDIPICDPYRSKMKEHINGMKTFTFDQEKFFEGYVQFKDYVGFTRAMDAFRGMKLLRKEGNDNAQTVNIKVDFDRTKHLCDASIRRRQIVRDRLILKDQEREEKQKEEKLKLNHQEEEKRFRHLYFVDFFFNFWFCVNLSKFKLLHLKK